MRVFRSRETDPLPLVPGLSLRDPNSTNIPLLAGDAQKALGDKLDAFLLGNVGLGLLYLLDMFALNTFWWIGTRSL